MTDELRLTGGTQGCGESGTATQHVNVSGRIPGGQPG